MEQELFVVELLLNASHHGVRDRTVVAHAEQLLPLGGEQLACEPQVRDGFGLDRGLEHAVRVAAQVALAAARMRVSPPRRPAQPTTVNTCQRGRGSRGRSRGPNSQRKFPAK